MENMFLGQNAWWRSCTYNFNKYAESTVGIQNNNIRKSIDFFKNNQLQNSISEKNYSESYKFPKSGKNLFKMRLQAINYLGFSHCICEEKINLKTLNIWIKSIYTLFLCSVLYCTYLYCTVLACLPGLPCGRTGICHLP